MWCDGRVDRRVSKVDVKKRPRYLGARVGRYGEELVKEQEVVRGRGLGCVKIYRGAGTSAGHASGYLSTEIMNRLQAKIEK